MGLVERFRRSTGGGGMVSGFKFFVQLKGQSEGSNLILAHIEAAEPAEF